MKPDESEFQIALDEAERIREKDEDSCHMAKCLFYLHQRNNDLEDVFKHLERYLLFGQPVEEHAALIRLVEGIREREDVVDDTKGFGL